MKSIIRSVTPVLGIVTRNSTRVSSTKPLSIFASKSIYSYRCFHTTNTLLRPKDPYTVLGVSRDASQDDIKKKFRELAKQYHPDKNSSPDAKEKFAEINTAYQILGDEEKRKAYDMTGDAGHAQNFDMGGMGGNPFGEGGFNPFGGGFGFDPNDIFSQMFGGAARGGSHPRRGADVQLALRLTFKEAVSGVTKDVSYMGTETCGTCKGSGAKQGTKRTTCPLCKGTGMERKSSGFMIVEMPCRRCKGAGTYIEDPCNTCSGSGHVRSRKNIEVKVPAGVDTGVNLRLVGLGEPGEKGGEPGNLYVQIEVEDDPVFTRDGYDVHVDTPITLSQAILGGVVTVPTLYGDVEVKVAPGTQPGEKRVLRGKGIKKRNSAGNGNQYIHFVVAIPKSLTPEQRSLIEEFAKQEEPVEKSGKGLFSKMREFFKKDKSEK